MIRHAKVAIGVDPADPGVIGKTKWNDDHFGPKFIVFSWSSGTPNLIIAPVAGQEFMFNLRETQFDFTNVTKVGLLAVRDGSLANAGRLFAMGNNGAPDAWDYLGNAAQTPGIALNVTGGVYEAEVNIRPSMQVPNVRVRIATEGGSGIATNLYQLQLWAR